METRLINIEWNNWNGFVFELIGFNDNYLFSLNSSWKEFFIMQFLFIQFEIYCKNELK